MVIGLRFYSLFQLTVSPRFFAFFMQHPGIAGELYGAGTVRRALANQKPVETV